MLLTVVAAIDFALGKALHRERPFADPATLAIIVLLYDALAYSLWRVALKIIHPEVGDDPVTVMVMALTVVVIGGCAGFPLLLVVAILLDRW